MAKAKKDIHSSIHVFDVKAANSGNSCRGDGRLSKVDVRRHNFESDGTNQDLCKSTKNVGQRPHPSHAEQTLQILGWKNGNRPDQQRNVRRI